MYIIFRRRVPTATFPPLRGAFQSKKGFIVARRTHMFKAIGFVIVLYALSHFFTSAFVALDDAATESFRTLETAAIVSQIHLKEGF